ncbi:MAG TPA: Spy/CpxP family protein refolding chaperone [Burkholderiales bacterium]|nr:Spy/CpxP family protein refolding chaperone [Burkholderiales bacterium]
MGFKGLFPAIAIGIIITLATFESPAQFGGGTPGGGMRGNRARPDGASREQRPPVQDNTPEQVEDRLGLLEEDLQLRPDQRAAWQACADKINAYATDIGREQSRGTASAVSLNSLQQIDRAVDVARNRLTALEDISATAKTLYGTLSAQQKSVVDPRLANIVSSIASPSRERTTKPKPPF